VCALGGRAGLYGPRTRDAAGQLIDAQLSARGIALYAEPQDARCGTVVSARQAGVVGGVQTSLEIVSGPVVDVTGAGDALAPAYLLGGPRLAMSAAARCVSQVGAQPPL
jgi:sugar/nucleoside kinase (ribokinase family)